ncbi:MAG: FAD-dependent monooxygenase [Bacillota bacterium]
MSCERVIIIGGGISGLCSALILQKIGINVKVFDQEDAPRTSETGMILGGNALKALDYIGVGDWIRKAAISSNNCTILSESGKTIVDFSYHSRHDFSNFLFILHQDFYKILAESLDSETLHYAKKLVHFKQSKHNIQLSFLDGTTIETDYLIACDGCYSFIRSQLSSSNIAISNQTYWHGLLEVDEDISDLGYSETWGPRGRFGIAPMPNKKLYWYAVKNADGKNDPYEKWASLDLLFNFFSYHEPIQLILEKTKDENIIRKELVELKPLQQYLYGRVLLLGDSAHIVPSHLGQGASQAIEDAMYLAMCMKIGKPFHESLIKYEQQRLIRTKTVSTEMKRLQSIAQIDKPALCSIRNHFLKLVPASFHESKLKGLFDIQLIG